MFVCVCLYAFLVYQNPHAHPRPISQDLAGFWDMLQLSIENISLKFDELHQLKANNWKPLTPPEIQVQTQIDLTSNVFGNALLTCMLSAVITVYLNKSYWFTAKLSMQTVLHTVMLPAWRHHLYLCLFCLVVDSELLLRSFSTCHAPLGPVRLQWSLLPHAMATTVLSYPTQMAATVSHNLIQNCMLWHYADNSYTALSLTLTQSRLQSCCSLLCLAAACHEDSVVCH